MYKFKFYNMAATKVGNNFSDNEQTSARDRGIDHFLLR